MYEYKPYTYKVTHKETGQFYYGCKYSQDGYTHPNLFWNTKHKKGYFTSSKLINKMIEEYGYDAFDIEIRKTFSCPEETFLFEQKVLRKIIDWENCLNAGVGGSYDCNKQRKIKINGVSSYDIGRIKNVEYWNAIDDESGLTNGKLRGLKLKGVPKSKEHFEKVLNTSNLIGDDGLNSYQRGALKRKGENNSSKKKENREKISKGVKEYLENLTDEEKLIIKNNHLEAMRSKDVRKKISEWNQLNNPSKETLWYNDGVKDYRLKQNDELISKLNLKEGRMKFEIIRTEHTCSHCQKTGKGPNMKRYHFDKCKFKKEIL